MLVLPGLRGAHRQILMSCHKVRRLQERRRCSLNLAVGLVSRQPCLPPSPSHFAFFFIHNLPTDGIERALPHFGYVFRQFHAFHRQISRLELPYHTAIVSRAAGCRVETLALAGDPESDRRPPL